jgi:hypothetical protein
MNCSAQDIMDAIITAAERCGSDGRGKDGLDGHMYKLARTNRRRFGILLGRALRLKMKAKPDERDRLGSNKYILTREEAEAQLREHGIPVEVLRLMPHPSPEEVLAGPPESAEPNSTRDLMEAVFNAAIRHGSDGHGKDGLPGYMLLLQRTEPGTFD